MITTDINGFQISVVMPIYTTHCESLSILKEPYEDEISLTSVKYI